VRRGGSLTLARDPRTQPRRSPPRRAAHDGVAHGFLVSTTTTRAGGRSWASIPAKLRDAEDLANFSVSSVGAAPSPHVHSHQRARRHWQFARNLTIRSPQRPGGAVQRWPQTRQRTGRPRARGRVERTKSAQKTGDRPPLADNEPVVTDARTRLGPRRRWHISQASRVVVRDVIGGRSNGRRACARRGAVVGARAGDRECARRRQASPRQRRDESRRRAKAASRDVQG